MAFRAEDYKKRSRGEVTLVDGNTVEVRGIYAFDFEKFGDVPEEFIVELASGKEVTPEKLKGKLELKFFDELFRYVLTHCVIPQEGFKIVEKEPGSEGQGEISYKELDSDDQLKIFGMAMEKTTLAKKGETPADAGRFQGEGD